MFLFWELHLKAYNMLWWKLSKFKSPHDRNNNKKERFLRLDIRSQSKISLCCGFCFLSLLFPSLFLTVNFLEIWGGGVFLDSEITQQRSYSMALITWWGWDSPSLRIRQGISNNHGLSTLLFILLTLGLILKDVECSSPGPGRPCLCVSLNQYQNAQNLLG